MTTENTAYTEKEIITNEKGKRGKNMEMIYYTVY